jgi:spermidine/putrescine transport system ATP-binding protein
MASLPVHRRNFGLVFQDYALFPHLTVSGNVAFGLKMQNLPKDEINRRVAESLERVNLAPFASRRVTDLSGGEQQRVALARALAPGPRLLMFDEPLGALDRTLKEELLGEVRRILHATGVPAIYVTHDQEEASAVADRLLLLHAGRIVRDGTPAEVWRAPGSAWAARFLGLGNVIQAEVRSGKVKGEWVARTAFGRFPVRCGHAHAAGETVSILLRPSTVRVEAGGSLRGRVADVLFQKTYYRVTLENGLVFHLPEAPQVGARIRLHVPVSAVECLA